MSTTATPDHPLARRTRQHFVAELTRRLGEVGAAVKERLTQALEQVSSVREMQERRDAWTLFQSHGRAWEEAVAAAWQRAARADPAAVPSKPVPPVLELTLVGDDVVENKILASRMALALRERVGGPLAELCVRVQQLDKSDELPPDDVLRPETLMLLLVEQWLATRLPRASLLLAVEAVQRELAAHLLDACNSCEALLVSAGVQTDGETKYRVRLTQVSPAAMGQAQAHRDAPTGQDALDSMLPDPGRRGPNTAQPLAQDDGQRNRHLADGQMVAAMSPLARARRRAQGVLGQLRRVLSEQTAGIFESTAKQELTPTLAVALQRSQSMVDPDMLIGDTESGGGVAYTQASVVRVAGVLRERSNELKKKASTDGEKATIEIVALMFQSILAEERIPAAVRVWFARLQLPVLRVALAEPEFFGTLNHPARQLIDRMGSCALGFDAHAIGGSALEAEIRRVVQVIEQYPETGRRVFQLVYDEFQKFLSKYLTEKGAASKVVSVAQQVEQKETLAIQYTIELRNMLKDMPVRDEVREFLFKVWAEVLAMAAVRKGPQDEETVAFKRSAADLVWAASAKPNRADRARVIQSLPALLQRLRQGMTLLGLTSPAQEVHIKRISDTLADAFMSKTEAIPQARIDMMAQRLANLEDFVSDESMGDLPLDADSIELMLGIDASSIDVIPDAGAKPSEAMVAWAHELQLGHWFTLDHNQKISQVQLAWRSERKQLFLFAAMDGRSTLIQAKRLAAYLQAGLLIPQEEEALTLRATRQALEKLDANPGRLLAV
ncbi:DUF1631 family protein [Pseudorhodoferax sp. Leaf274]|uniref:DUF1631 family protein n=1 Tax=Pseudorhodoferax sp. Leaf274 TaxID=1736318 RepID=UPI0007032D8E|nr:DUF1631 family protein [Pseudorhodoferax sp. Leaf274]KQP49743.1 hypothetical protein ASF44_03975 [Pseudorhodoferax sp. Leaf274]